MPESCWHMRKFKVCVIAFYDAMISDNYLKACAALWVAVDAASYMSGSDLYYADATISFCDRWLTFLG